MLSPARPGRQRVGGVPGYLRHNSSRYHTATELHPKSYDWRTLLLPIGVLLRLTTCALDDPVHPRRHGKEICTAEWLLVGYWNRMSYRQLLRRAFNGNAPIKQYESYTLAMSSVSMVIHPYKPAGTALAGRGGVGSAKPRDNQSRTRLPSSNAWWQALLSLCLVRLTPGK